LVGLVSHGLSDLDFRTDKRIDAAFDRRHFGELSGDIRELKTQMKDLKDLLGVMVNKQLKASVQLPESTFERMLPGVEAQIRVARLQKTAVPTETIADLQEKISGVATRNSQYWSAMGQLASYRSVAALAFPITPTRSCLDDPKVTHRETGVLWTHVEDQMMSNCYLDLGSINEFYSSPFGAGFKGMVDKYGPPGYLRLFLENVHLVYHGGPMIPAFQIFCKDCTYDFDAERSISIDGKTLISAVSSAASVGQVTVGFRRVFPGG
jgi:hypothetical protein